MESRSKLKGTNKTVTKSSNSLQFINKLQANLLMQHIDTPTRARGMDTIHILDLETTNNDIIDNVDYLAPLGKIDHSVLIITSSPRNSTVENVDQH